MLTFEEKLAIILSFSELQRRDVSLGRINFHYEKSAYEKKTVVYHLHPNGNGFVYAGQLQGYPTEDKGFVNIRDFSADELRHLIEASIHSLSPQNTESQKEYWQGPSEQSLIVTHADDMWYIYAGQSLEDAYETYEEVEQYMQQEGFKQRK
jgi:hypothetical protein